MNARTKRNVSLIALGLIMGGTVASTHALNLGGYSGPIKIKITGFDTGSLYDPTLAAGVYNGEGTLNALTVQGPLNGQGGEDTWGVFKVTEIITEGAGPAVTLFNDATSATELTGIFWGGKDQRLEVGSFLGQKYYDLSATGMHIALFEDAAKDFDALAALGPNAAGARAGGNPVYNGATDGSLIWTFDTIPGFRTTQPTFEFFSTYFFQASGPGAISGNGGTLGEASSVPFWGTGSLNDILASELELNFTFEDYFTQTQTPNSWLTIVDDPGRVQITAVPEPVSAGLSLSALAALAFAGTRRRQA